jgi:hypothetical protein
MVIYVFSFWKFLNICMVGKDVLPTIYRREIRRRFVMVLEVAGPATYPALPSLQLISRSFLLVRLDITPCGKKNTAPLMLRWPAPSTWQHDNHFSAP